MPTVDAWWDFLKQSGAPPDMPDSAYDALLEKFFYEREAPLIAAKGLSIEESKDSYMKAASRPGKSSWPKMELLGASAGKALLNPVLGLSGKHAVQKDLEKLVEFKKQEALRQGSSPMALMGTEMAGDLVGTLPYFALGSVGAGSVASKLASRLGVGKVAGQAAATAAELGPEVAARAGQLAWDAGVNEIKRVAMVPAIGAVQGAYDAASAEDGHRVTEGLTGLGVGMLLGAGFEGVTNPRQALRMLGMGPVEAEAVATAARGVGSDATLAIAEQAAKQYPNIQGTLEQYLAKQVQLAKKTATPREPLEIAKGSKFTISMRAADGSEYMLRNQDPAKIDQLVNTVDRHLQQGGEILKVNGDADVVNKLYLQFENIAKSRGEYELPVRVKGGDPDAGPLMLYVPREGDAVVPSPALPSRASNKIDVQDLSPSSLFEKMPNGMILDKAEQRVYGSMEEALQARGYKFEVGDTWQGEGPMQGTQFKETPTQVRGVGMPQGTPQAFGMTQSQGAGSKPIIIYNHVQQNIRRTMFHEQVHGALAYMGNEQAVVDAVAAIPGTRDLLNAFSSKVKKLAGPYLNEELVTHLTSAIRTNEGQKLAGFVQADESLEEVMQVGVNVARTVKELALREPDSLWQRQLTRQMDDVIRRAGSIADLKREAGLMGDTLSIKDGGFMLENAGRRKQFRTRDELVEYMEQYYREPLNAPNLVDETHIPNMPRYAAQGAMAPPGAPPVTTVMPPLSSGSGARTRIAGGSDALFSVVRPFFAWLDSVTSRAGTPEMYHAMKALDLKQVQFDNFVAPYEKVLTGIFKGYDVGRRADLYQYMETPLAGKERVAKLLNLTKKELNDAQKLRTEFYDPLFKEFGIDSELYLQEYMPRLRAVDGDVSKVKPGGRLSKADVDFFAKYQRTGMLEPKDTDALSVSHRYLRMGAQEKFLGDDLARAAELVNEKLEDGSFRYGTLQPFLKRHLDYMQSRPDLTQQMVTGHMQSILDVANETLAAANKHLPSAMQIGPIKMPANDVLGRMMLFSYASTSGVMRPMTLLRDGIQFFLTDYPILGEKYGAQAWAKVFGKAVKGKEARRELWSVPEKYGVFQSNKDIANLYAAGNESLGMSKAVKVAEGMLKPMEWENNANRLLSFWGHADKAFDAITAFSNNPKQLAKKSGLIYLDKPLQESFMKEIATAAPQQWQDISYRIAKEMTDVTQWNYRKGAMPGYSKFALGRLFGQYGSWPMNYIEYLRRLGRSGDKYDKGAATVRILAMHGAVLKMGEVAGIDTAQWVFQGPALYGGGPLLTTATQAPYAFDTQTQRGVEAREQLRRQAVMMVPGGLAMDKWYAATQSDNPAELWKVIGGFDDLTLKEAEEGLHRLVP